MDSYNLIIYKVIVFYIPQKNRNIKKKYYKKIDIVYNVSNKDITKTTLDLYKKYKYDNNIIIVNVNVKDNVNTEYDYYTKLNRKSQKMYLDYKINNELIQSNINIKKDKLKYYKHDDYIIKNVLSDIDRI